MGCIVQMRENAVFALETVWILVVSFPVLVIWIYGCKAHQIAVFTNTFFHVRYAFIQQSEVDTWCVLIFSMCDYIMAD